MSDCGCFSHGGFLTSRGLREVAQRELEFDGVDAMESSSYLDRVGSVSASEPMEIIFDDGVLDQQYRRFLSGS